MRSAVALAALLTGCDWFHNRPPVQSSSSDPDWQAADLPTDSKNLRRYERVAVDSFWSGCCTGREIRNLYVHPPGEKPRRTQIGEWTVSPDGAWLVAVRGDSDLSEKSDHPRVFVVNAARGSIHADLPLRRFGYRLGAWNPSRPQLLIRSASHVDRPEALLLDIRMRSAVLLLRAEEEECIEMPQNPWSEDGNSIAFWVTTYHKWDPSFRHNERRLKSSHLVQFVLTSAPMPLLRRSLPLQPELKWKRGIAGVE